MEYNSGSNRTFKIGEVISTRSAFEITSPIIPELYDTKSYCRLIVSITKCENLSREYLLM